MFKKVLLMLIFSLLITTLNSLSLSGKRYGYSLGIFYTEQDFIKNETNIETQVDSMTLFMANMKFGCLLRVGWNIDRYLGLGIESGALFNSYHLNIPLRVYSVIGKPEINIKPIFGVSYIREVSYRGSGMEDIANGFSIEYGGRVELFHVYLEYLKSNSLSSDFLDSTKISFGYSLFFPNIR